MTRQPVHLAIAGLISLCCVSCAPSPQAKVVVKEARITELRIPVLQASTTPDRQVRISGELSLGAEGVFAPDELLAAVERERKRLGPSAPELTGWILSNDPKLQPRFDAAYAEAKRLGIEQNGLNLRVRMTGSYRGLATPASGYDREFHATSIEQMVVCPRRPAAFEGCSNY